MGPKARSVFSKSTQLPDLAPHSPAPSHETIRSSPGSNLRLPQIIERPHGTRRSKEEIENHADHSGIEAPDRSKLQPPDQHNHHQPDKIEPRKRHQRAKP